MLTSVEVGGEQRTVLKGIRWHTFEALLAETGDDRHTRFAYDGFALEIMTPLYEHEGRKTQIHNFIVVFADLFETQLRSAGSTTLRQQARQKGIEPDNCYYIQNASAIAGKRRIDLTLDPPPDLAIEIDITHSSLDKLQIYADLGVPELWRYEGDRLTFYGLQGGRYQEISHSVAFPLVSSAGLEPFLQRSWEEDDMGVLRSLREWVRSL